MARRTLTAEQVRRKLREFVAFYGSQRMAAQALGVALSNLNRCLTSTDAPSPKLLAALGLRRVVRYEDVLP